MRKSPVQYTDELADEICERLANGESLNMICKEDRFPNKSAVFRWLATNEVFEKMYITAREIQIDAMVDEMLDIADDGSNDTLHDKHGNAYMDKEWVQRSRIRIDTRKWIAAKLKPKVYSDRVTSVIEGGDKPVSMDMTGELGQLTPLELELVKAVADQAAKEQ